jgi:RNA polymerase sigma-70 factor (ECF subfamily)
LPWLRRPGATRNEEGGWKVKKTSWFPGKGAAPAATAEAILAAKVRWLEGCGTALDSGGMVVLHATFPTIMRTHYQRMWRRILKWRVPPRDAEDLIQEIFLSLFQHISRRGAALGLKTILGVIAKGKLLHFARDQRNAPESVCLPSSGSALPDSMPDLAQAVDLRRLPQRLFPGLSPEQRAIVEQVMMGGLTHAEAAVALGISEGRVKAHVARLERVLFVRAQGWVPVSQRSVA